MMSIVCFVVVVCIPLHWVEGFTDEVFVDLKKEVESLRKSQIIMATQMNRLVEIIDAAGVVDGHDKRFLSDPEAGIHQELQNLKMEFQQLKDGMGSTFVRWGRTVCPDNSSNAVYKGYTGGKHYSDTGGAANYVCLPEDPTWPATYKDGLQDYGSRMYGTEYEDSDVSGMSPFHAQMDNDNAACVVCRSERATTVMIPARSNCYKGWHQEYTGYLMSDARWHHSSSEYICVDKDAEAIRQNGSASMDGNLLYVVEAVCGSLPCLPYVQGRELACVVCSK